jgi:hypothetical protein
VLLVLRGVVSLAVLVSLSGFYASIAAADAGGSPDEKNESHCVMFVIGQRADGELILSDADCFADELSAELWSSYGVPEAGSETAADGSGSVYAASSTFTLGRHYDGVGGTGSSVRIVGSSCIGGYWNTSSSWDNRISSSYNGCAQLKHWDLPDKSGTVESTYGAGTTDNLGYMDNRTESVSYH